MKLHQYSGLSGALCIILCSTQASLWGIEANYPGSDNAYLSEVAGELLPDALAAGRAALTRLMASAPAQASRG